ncbi:hypothetical protein [Dyadobacter pollutisoli]|uniref:TerB family tellurite resistance protein n=1 Tax=Dyadobacter pollutisoli TaxID=2910158 RepID=A0A9E8NET3_9BACT|nr:hypothetical protein [Dyadobacter pollutisoli]WAC13256.1 hypothetical protein ON006_04685 [Dyadobacter pollutisoli]
MINKTMLLAIWLALLQTACHGQRFKEWFRQNKTQKQYLLEQIAQLKIYLELTQKGYRIARQGLATIHQLKNGEFKLHKNRFDSLLTVNSSITSLDRLQQISDMHGSINQICEKLPAELAQCTGLADVQRKQVRTALDRLYQDCQVLIGGFLSVIRSGQLRMTDDERITRIQAIHQQFESNYIFAESLRRQVGLLCKQAAAQEDEMNHRQIIHGFN